MPVDPRFPNNFASPAVYNPNQDPTRNIQASNQQNAAPIRASRNPMPNKSPRPPVNRFRQGPTSRARRRVTSCSKRARPPCTHDRDRAYQCFRQAMNYANELDQATAQRLQDHLQLLSSPNVRPAPALGPAGSPVVAEAVARQQALARQLATELNHQEDVAKNLLPKDPKMSLSILQQERQKIDAAGLDPPNVATPCCGASIAVWRRRSNTSSRTARASSWRTRTTVPERKSIVRKRRSTARGKGRRVGE